MLVSFLFCLSCQKNRGGWHCRSKKIRRIVLTRIKVDKQISMNSETDQKADWWKKKCMGERNKHALFFSFFLLCVCKKKKNYWLLWFQALDLSFMTLETQCLLYSLKFIWWANKGPVESKGENEIKWRFERKPVQTVIVSLLNLNWNHYLKFFLSKNWMRKRFSEIIWYKPFRTWLMSCWSSSDLKNKELNMRLWHNSPMFC